MLTAMIILGWMLGWFRETPGLFIFFLFIFSLDHE